MAAVWMRLRAELRTRWRAMLGLALLLAVMAGAATAAAAGARRTETAYPRFFDRYRVADLSIATNGDLRGEEVFTIAASLPQVEGTVRMSIFPGSVKAPSGHGATFPDVFVVADHERRPDRLGRKIVDGRMSIPTRSDETVVNYAMADRLELGVGDVLHITLTGPSDAEPPLPPQAVDVRVVGIYAAAGEFESASGGGFTTTITMTPAFRDRWLRYHFAGEDELGIFLRGGQSAVTAYATDLNQTLEERGLGDVLDDEPVPSSALTPGVQSLNRVSAVALWLLCGFLGISTFAVVSQLLARESRVGAGDGSALRALGMGRGQLIVSTMARSGVVAVGGGLLSAAVAYLLSPLTPVGLARIAEPDPGFTLAPSIVGIGAAGTIALMSLAALGPAWATARAAAGVDGVGARRPPLLLERLARMRLSLSAQSGLRMASAGSGERAIPTRTAILGTTIAIGALATALTFATSLAHLTADPRLAGYAWDAGAIAAIFDPATQDEMIGRIERNARARLPGARIWRGTAFYAAFVDGELLPAWVSDGPDPSIIEGRAPRRPDEVALDARTLRSIGKRIGGLVEVAPYIDAKVSAPASSMKVVGLFAVPRIAFQGANPGQGVAMTPAGIDLVQPGADYREAVYADFPPGMSFERGVEALRAAAGDDLFAIVNRQQSATVGNVERLSFMPIVLAGTTGFLGVATLAYALTSTIRRRRRDLAILKTMGFVGRQVRATVAWQSTALVSAALVIGLPLGIAGGRWGWRLFARELQVVPVPVVSSVVVVSVVAGAIALGNVIAAFPARVAARTEPAVVLRTE